MIDWIPVAFVVFKLLAFGTCMFFAIKWHYDQGNKRMDKRALVGAGCKVAAIFMLLLLGAGLFIYTLASSFGLDLHLP